MLKKIFLTVFLILTVTISTSCNFNNNNDNEEEVDYIITKKLPKESYAGITDNANPAFAKIYPHFNRGNYPEGRDEIQWFKTGLGSKIVPFKRGKLLEVINTDRAFVAYIGNVDEEMFREYFIDLAVSGYIFQGDRHWDDMNLVNEQYAINLRFCQEGRDITTIRARILTPAERRQAIEEIKAKKEQDRAMEEQNQNK